MRIIDCEQGSPEWFKARAGIPTASEFHTVLAKGKGGGESLTRKTYLLKLAGEMLNRDDTPGTILFVADGMPLHEYPRQGKHQLIGLGIGTSRGGPIPGGGVAQFSWSSFEEFRNKTGAVVTSVTLDNSDVRRIQSHVQTHLQDVLNREQNLHWIDSGYWLTLPIVILAALWFRRGFVVQWHVIAFVMLGGSSAYGADTEDPLWMRWFLTPDQQGRYYLEHGDYSSAARCFEDAQWKGIALYRAGDFESAARADQKASS